MWSEVFLSQDLLQIPDNYELEVLATHPRLQRTNLIGSNTDVHSHIRWPRLLRRGSLSDHSFIVLRVSQHAILILILFLLWSQLLFFSSWWKDKYQVRREKLERNSLLTNTLKMEYSLVLVQTIQGTKIPVDLNWKHYWLLDYYLLVQWRHVILFVQKNDWGSTMCGTLY